MPHAIRTPRINNNDDTVRLARLLVSPGVSVAPGDVVAEVETDKANYVVEADGGGFVLQPLPASGATLQVGSVLLWLGHTADEHVPKNGTERQTVGHVEPTLKAAQLLSRHGLRAEDVPAAGDRLMVSDVEAFLRRQGMVDGRREQRMAPAASLPESAGVLQDLSPAERAVVRTVTWQRDEAVPCYVEIPFDASAWDQLAREYQQRAGLLLSPLLGLLAFRLVQAAKSHGRLNATIAGEQRLQYSAVNLGFTVQSEQTLYLVVVKDAERMECRQFLQRLSALQRKAMAARLEEADISHATIGFTSMARWSVSRHIPVLAPHTGFMLAHAEADKDGRAVIGATYDHRLMSGFDAVAALQAVAAPELPE